MISTQVMERLFWPKPALIKAVTGDEAWIGSLIDAITTNIKKALEPCEAYLECFKQWEQFLNLDVDEYVSNLKHAVPIRVEIKCTAPYGPVTASARRRGGSRSPPGASRSLDAVRTASKSSDGHESRRRREDR